MGDHPLARPERWSPRSWAPTKAKSPTTPSGAASAATWARRIAAVLLLALALPAFAAELPPDSVYQLDVPLVDQDARALRFPAQRGRVRIVSMFYANCPYVCPLIIDTLKHTERALDDAERKRLHVTLVSLDPERDSPAALDAVATKRGLDRTRWTLARAESRDVRKLAAVLGIQYRQLEDREFNHSSVLVLLDAEGRVVARSSRLGEPDPEFVKAVRDTLAATPDP